MPAIARDRGEEPRTVIDDRDPLRVVVTGFGPFLQHDVNPSWEAIRPLQGLTSLAGPSTPRPTRSTPDRPVSVTCLEIEVCYREALAIVPSLHGIRSADTRQGAAPGPAFDLFLHVGVGHPGRYALESQAHRWGFTAPKAPDMRGEHAPQDERCDRYGLAGSEWDGPTKANRQWDERLDATIDVARLHRWLTERVGDGSVVLSDDAGTYLCDFTFGLSLRSAERQVRGKGVKPSPVLFVHVPPVDEQHSHEQMTDFIRLVLWALVNGDFINWDDRVEGESDSMV